MKTAATDWTAAEAKQVARVEELTGEYLKLQAEGKYAAARQVMTSLQLAESFLAGMVHAA